MQIYSTNGSTQHRLRRDRIDCQDAFCSYKRHCDDTCSMPRIVGIRRTRHQNNAENPRHTRSKC